MNILLLEMIDADKETRDFFEKTKIAEKIGNGELFEHNIQSFLHKEDRDYIVKQGLIPYFLEGEISGDMLETLASAKKLPIMGEITELLKKGEITENQAATEIINYKSKK